jgi:EAL domain-containing protein (putative c-di-GMP-specific phosphodiesterase class I)
LQLSLFTPLLERATRDVVAQLGQPCLLMSSNDIIRFANASFLETLAIDGPVQGASLFDIAGGAFDTPAFRERLADLRQGGRVHGWQLAATFPDVGRKVLSIDLVSIRGGFFETGLVVLAMRDETERFELASDILRKDHDQADLAARLNRLRAAETPSATARRIIDEMARVPGFDFLGLAVFGPSGRLVPLALNVPPTAPVAVGQPIPEGRASHLHDRAMTGPWIETWHARPEDGSYGAQMSSTGLRSIAYAPIHGPTSLVGLMMMGTTQAGPAESIGDQFPALLSFAAIAGALLGPAQERHNQEAAARFEIESIIVDEAFEPVFQPIVELATGRIVGYEALTRFADGVTPTERFADASLLGIGRELELACARRSLEAAVDLPDGVWIGVNTSPGILLHGSELATILGTTPRDIVLEITEHAAVPDYALLHAAIADLGRGVRVAVDDAGAGYAGLQRILELRADLVKLDIVLVRGIESDPARQALVAGMVHFARRTDSRLLAEGIESDAEAKTLLDLGVEFGQGYLFGHPAPASRVAVGPLIKVG